MCIYPVVFSITLAITSGSSASVTRFSAAIPALAFAILIIYHSGWSPVRLLLMIGTLGVTAAMVMNTYQYVYRDSEIGKLNYKVESGVYKGLYTTEERGRDVMELEAFLNQSVEETEYYAFRDNVPAGYLMMHKGIMCDRSTWDCLQYTYGKTAQANLYAYYQRRGIIPNKIIYVDFGRDKQLSIDTEGFPYNAFVKAYYGMTGETKLNTTFKQVKLFEYNGTFDGDYDKWIQPQ